MNSVVFWLIWFTAFPTIERKEQIPIPGRRDKRTLATGDFHTQEERRLLRRNDTGQDQLYLTAARYYGEGKRGKRLSPFITEHGGENIELQITSTNPAKRNTLIDWAKTEESAKPIRQPITYVSYSLSTFTTCPLQYKYRAL